MIDYSLILVTNYANKQWSIGETYESLEWLDKSPKPTQVELDALWESTLTAAQTAKAAKQLIKDSALAKLKKLGLTDDEISALKGTL